MATITLQFQRNQSCPNPQAYQVRQVGPGSVANANVGDTIEFKRIGPAQEKGFDITFYSLDPAKPPPANITVPPQAAGPTSGSFTVTASTPSIKYDVSFKNDGVAVDPLDPVIIINPNVPLAPKPFITVRDVVAFAVGAAVAFVLLQMM